MQKGSVSVGAVAGLLALCRYSSAHVVIDPCDGSHEIPGSGYFACPKHSDSCGGGLFHLWGGWKGCCCRAGYSFQRVEDDLLECVSCSGDGGHSEGSATAEPFWWRTLHLPSPDGLRDRMSCVTGLMILPWLLRAGAQWLLVHCVLWLFQCFGYECKWLESFVRNPVGFVLGGLQVTDQALLPGAVAVIRYSSGRREVRQLTEKDIQDFRQRREGLGEPLLEATVEIKLASQDPGWMSFEQMSRALSYPDPSNYVIASVHLVGWHLLQVFFFGISYLSVCDIIDDMQIVLSGIAFLREVLYAIFIVMGIVWKPAYLLFQPVKAWSAGKKVEAAAYAAQPEKWLLKLLFVNHAQKPCSFYVLLALCLLFDTFGVIALLHGIWVGSLPWQLMTCYLLLCMSLLVTAVTLLLTNFFQEACDAEFEDLLLQFLAANLVQVKASAGELVGHGIQRGHLAGAGYSAPALLNLGYVPANLKDLGFPVPELKEAGVGAPELKEAGFPLPELKEAGFGAFELKDAGFRAAELRLAGLELFEIRLAGFGVAELMKAGFSLRQLKEAGCGAAVLKNAGFPLPALKEAGFRAAELEEADTVTYLFDCMPFVAQRESLCV